MKLNFWFWMRIFSLVFSLFALWYSITTYNEIKRRIPSSSDLILSNESPKIFFSNKGLIKGFYKDSEGIWRDQDGNKVVIVQSHSIGGRRYIDIEEKEDKIFRYYLGEEK